MPNGFNLAQAGQRQRALWHNAPNQAGLHAPAKWHMRQLTGLRFVRSCITVLKQGWGRLIQRNADNPFFMPVHRSSSETLNIFLTCRFINTFLDFPHILWITLLKTRAGISRKAKIQAAAWLCPDSRQIHHLYKNQWVTSSMRF